MSGQLTVQDRALIRTLRGEGILEDVRDHLFDQSNGVILVACSDADRFFDLYSRQVNMQTKHRPTPRIHAFGWHGGALACAPCSPINKLKRADRVFMSQIADACPMKGIYSVALYAHAPCGAVYSCGLPLEKVLALHMRVKTRIEETMNHRTDVVCFFHADYGDGIMRTYRLSHKQWKSWAREHGMQAIA